MPLNQSHEPIKYFSTRDHADRLSFEEVSDALPKGGDQVAGKMG